jgi:zinc transport system substrate-binding protein
MHIINRFVLLASVLLLFSCSGSMKQENKITVTIEPQRYFAEQLSKPVYEIVTMVPPGTSPESYDPTPQQMTHIVKSKAYFCIGYIGFETVWLDKLKKNNPETRFFDNSQGISFISSEEDLDHSPSGIDPHTWASPKQALVIVQNMYNALVEIDPENTLVYQTNLEALEQEIRETDKRVRSYLDGSSQKAFIIYHPALTYFARDYGLTQYAIEIDGKEPTPSQIKELIDTADEKGIKTIFIQQEFDRKNAELIARETGCRMVVINPLSYRWSEEIIHIAKALSDE